MTQSQLDYCERVIALNPNFTVRCHEKPWGVIVEVGRILLPSRRWRVAHLVAVGPDGKPLDLHSIL